MPQAKSNLGDFPGAIGHGSHSREALDVQKRYDLQLFIDFKKNYSD